MSTGELHRQWNDFRQRHEAAFQKDNFELAAKHAETLVEVCRVLALDKAQAEKEAATVAAQKGK